MTSNFKHGDSVVFAETSYNQVQGLVGKSGTVFQPNWFLGLLIEVDGETVIIDGKPWPRYAYYFSNDIGIVGR